MEKAFSDLVGVARIGANHPHYAKLSGGTSRDAIDMDEEREAPAAHPRPSAPRGGGAASVL